MILSNSNFYETLFQIERILNLQFDYIWAQIYMLSSVISFKSCIDLVFVPIVYKLLLIRNLLPSMNIIEKETEKKNSNRFISEKIYQEEKTN